MSPQARTRLELRSHASGRRARAVSASLLSALLCALSGAAQAQDAAPVAAPPAADAAVVVAAAPSVTPEAPAADEPAAVPLAWDLTHRHYNTWNGAPGGLFLVDPQTGEPGAVRLQLGLSTFSGDDVLRKKDHVEQDEQMLSLSITGAKIFDFYASLGGRSTATSRPTPTSLSNMGDITLGGKLGTSISQVLFFGGDVRLGFANQVGGGGPTLAATSIGLRSAFSLDLQQLPEPVPFIARFNLGYYFDNSGQLVKELETKRYEKLNLPVAKEENESRQLISRFERLAMGINRIDRFSLGFGLETPVEVADRFFLHPLLEWRIDVPVNRQAYDCPFVNANKKSGTIDTAEDSCYERSSTSAFPMNLALGVRAVPPIRGVSVLLAADFGLNRTSNFVRELAPTVPYRLMLALSYDYDARPVEPVIVAPALPATPPAPPTGRIQGSAMSAEGGPVMGAIIAFANHDVSAVATSSDGHFVSEAFPAGEVQMEASHPDYETATCAATIPAAGGNVEALCTLTPKPRTGELRGRVIDAWGSPVVGTRIALSGPSSSPAISDVRGNFEATNLIEGEYTVRAESSAHFVRFAKITVVARETAALDITLMQKPLKPSVTVRGQTVVAPGLVFLGTSTDLDVSASQSIAELGDLLLTRSDLNIRVQGYGDDAVALSRALLIKQRLIDAGVPDSRVEAVGGGKSRVVITVLP